MSSLLDRYPGHKLLAEVGEGLLYSAPDKSDGGEVLITVFRKTEERREIRTDAITMIGRLHKVRPEQYPAVVASGTEQNGDQYLVLKKLPGGYLESRMRDGEKLTPASAIELIVSIIDVVQIVHETGMFLGVVDGWSFVFNAGKAGITRFGLAASGFAVGSVNAATELAPELTTPGAKPDFRSDIYGLGALLWRMLTGKVWDPNQGKIAVLAANNGFSPLIQTALMKTLDPNPAARFKTVDELANILQIEQQAEARNFGGSDDLSSPGLMVIEGEGRGLRLNLGLEEAIIGSNPGCRLAVAKMPPQAFSIKFDGTDCQLSRLGAASVQINGKTMLTRNATVSRGDQINAGQSVFRIIAPGEVFTLSDSIQSDSAEGREREFNRRVWPILTLAALISILGLGIFSWRVEKSDEDARRSKAEQIARKEKTVALLIEQGDGFFRDKAYRQPLCDGEVCNEPDNCMNAAECFQKALNIVPDDHYVIARLNQINELDPENGEPSLVLKEPTEEEMAKREAEEAAAAKAANEQKDPDSLLAKARTLVDKEQFLEPKGDNALEYIVQTLTIDPDNSDAHDLLTQMAAVAVNKGNLFRKAADGPNMLKWYGIAESLGVSPDYLRPLRRGAEVISGSKSSVVIVDGPTTHSKLTEEQRKKLGFIDPAALSQKLAVLELENPDVPTHGRTLVEAN
jgi:tetratricopeptide (TPR) repeat protein